MIEKLLSVQEAISAYPKDSCLDFIKASEEERQALLRRFPLEAWRDMPIENYAVGQEKSEDSFCRWMEFKALHLGSIRGGSARKLIIYKHKEKPGWYYDPVYRNEQDAWQAVRGAFVEAFELAARGEFDRIDELEPLRSGPALRLKALHLYYPNDILPVYSLAHIKHFLQLLGHTEKKGQDWEVVRVNRSLLAALREIPELGAWSTVGLMRFLYKWRDPRDSRRIVKIAPGENAMYWEDCLSGGYICVGWEQVGDLREFENKEAFQKRFAEIFAESYNNNKSTIAKKANELWTLIELEPGDIVMANKGTSRILAVGEVVEPGYELMPERRVYQHIVHVNWDVSYARDIESQKKWAFLTVAPVSNTLYEQIVKEKRGTALIPVEPLMKDIEAAIERKGQVVLYGPPGTGKTYHARRFAVWWLLKEQGDANPQVVLADKIAFEKAEQGLIDSLYMTLVTFHPSYSYEDFIEGFRPVDTDRGALALRLQDGVFKRVCSKAKENPGKKFLLLVDEINRANVAKVFGELITLLEKDKRGLIVTLPQSKLSFTIPQNVYVLGTMNTADRSIKLLDAALRRRFAFIELMPDVEIFRGAKVGGLPLDDFLEKLNRRIAAKEGREKQIGHSFLLEDGEPVEEPEELARRFRHEILPLLQEFCYDDYATLGEYLGEKIVNKDEQALNTEVLGDPDLLLTALEEEFAHPGAEG